MDQVAVVYVPEKIQKERLIPKPINRRRGTTTNC